uniref:Tudor domain-containing protein n=1 Tax=Strigamia maritima TaxID=126957 RepID=T1J8A3_STRMM
MANSAKTENRNTNNKTKKTRKWKIGDKCQTIYNGDGLCYAAVIKLINTEDNSCIVEFTGYGNTENVQLTSLMTTSKKQTMKKNHNLNPEPLLDINNDNGTPPSPISKDPLPTFGYQTFYPTSSNMLPKYQPPLASLSFGSFPASSAHTSGFVPQQPCPSSDPSNCFGSFSASSANIYTGVPPNCFGSIPVSSPHVSSCTPPPMSFMPPLPSPPVPTLDINNPDEVLGSTLMSWYMSGYNTGFYQALRQFKKQ